MVLKMAKTKIGEIEILVFRNRGSKFLARRRRKRRNSHICGFPFSRFRIHAVAGSDQMLVGGGGAPQEAQQVSDTNSHQPSAFRERAHS